MSDQNPMPTVEDVLLAFAVEPVQDRVTLEHYLKRYPQHAEALVDYSIELMIDPSRRRTNDEVPSEQIVAQAWRQFEEAVHSTNKETATNPFAHLNPAAFKAVARNLDITSLLLGRLRDRAIDAGTIPTRFVEILAVRLGSSFEAVIGYLRNPPAMVSSQSFRSGSNPVVGEKISFDQAVETSHLTATQQAALKALRD